MAHPTCSIEGCEKPRHGRMCRMHANRVARHGDPNIVLNPVGRSLAERFHERYEVAPNGCWLWRPPLTVAGYGTISVHNHGQLAHRISYELLVGPIPKGLELDHLCRTPACVNPAHLEPVTHRENLLRGRTVTAANARKTHCPKGHPYTPENIYRNAKGARACRICTIRKGVEGRRRRRKAA